MIEQFGIKLWRRVVDDIFIVMSKPREYLWVLSRMLKAHNPMLEFAAPDYCYQKLTFLDVEIYKSENGNKLLHRRYVKATSSGVPLGMRSADPEHIHEMWARARLGTLAKHCSTFVDFSHARKEFLERLRRFNIDPGVVAKVEVENPFTRNAVRRPFQPLKHQ